MKFRCQQCQGKISISSDWVGRQGVCPHCGSQFTVPAVEERIPNQVTALEVFVSSPGDVSSEREALIRTIERINRMPHIRNRYVLRPFRYEKEVAPQMGHAPQVIVDRACHVVDCYLVICILWKRMGTPFTDPVTKREFLSGTEYEFITAYEAKKAGAAYPNILIYRKKNDSSSGAADSSQQGLVDRFFSRMEGTDSDFKGLYFQFSDMSEFEENTLLHILNQIDQSPPRSLPAITLSAIVEEERRLDVAVPKKVAPTDIVELWAKVCLPGSDGLREELPETSEIPGAPLKSDTTDKFMSVAYERRADSDELMPLTTRIEVVTNDFEVLENDRVVELRKGVESPTIVFPLTVKTHSDNALIMVRVKTKSVHSDYWIENSSVVQRITVCRELKREGEVAPTRKQISSSLQLITCGGWEVPTEMDHERPPPIAAAPAAAVPAGAPVPAAALCEPVGASAEPT